MKLTVFDHADDFKTQIENGRCYDIYFMNRDAGYQRHGTGLYVHAIYFTVYCFCDAFIYGIQCEVYRYHAWQYITKDDIQLIPETMD